MKKGYCCPEAELLRFCGKETLAVQWKYEKITPYEAGSASPSEVDVPLPAYPDGEY